MSNKTADKTKQVEKIQEQVIAEEELNATWEEVYQECCVHEASEWLLIFAGLIGVIFFLYFFLVGLDLLGTGAKVMSGCRAGALFGDQTNPVAGLMIGILATVLLQSSSTTTSIVVSLVPSVISTRQGIYMIMGANIGTSITNTIVALGQMGDSEQLERAFAGATVHDIFNILLVCILLPIEVVTGYLYRITKLMVRNVKVTKDESWEGPISKLVEPLGARIITDNSSFIRKIAQGTASCTSGAEGSPYPLVCEEGEMNGENCKGGLIKCEDTFCPAFFQEGSSADDDKISGGVVFFLGLVLLFLCMYGLVSILQRMLLGVSSHIIYETTSINGYLGIIIGCGITMVVQSSSITTSVLTPFVGLGAIRLEQMFPMTIGANIGTTLTALMASLVSDSVLSLQVALAHLMFNVTGFLLFYPIPFMRNIPLSVARKLGQITRVWKVLPFVYIFVVFFAVPLLLFAISLMFTQGSKGMTVLGSFVVISLVVGIAYLIYWLTVKKGAEKWSGRLTMQQQRREANARLPDDMDYLKRSVQFLLTQMGFDETDVPESAPTDAARSRPVKALETGDDYEEGNVDDDDDYPVVVEEEAVA